MDMESLSDPIQIAIQFVLFKMTKGLTEIDGEETFANVSEAQVQHFLSLDATVLSTEMALQTLNETNQMMVPGDSVGDLDPDLQDSHCQKDVNKENFLDTMYEM